MPFSSLDDGEYVIIIDGPRLRRLRQPFLAAHTPRLHFKQPCEKEDALPVMKCLLFVLLCSVFPVFVAGAQDSQHPLHTNGRGPNIIVILTDDQDVQMGSLSFMPHLKEHLIDRGLQFKRHYCTVALCCPSRVSLWTGKAARKYTYAFQSFQVAIVRS